MQLPSNTELLKWGKNTLIFAAPFLLIFLLAIQSGKSLQDAMYVLYLYGLNVAIDFLRKLIAENK